MISQSILAQLGIQLQVFRVFEGSEGFGSIYISSYYSAMQSQLLEKHQIKSVLSIAKGCCIKYDQQKVSNYLYIPAEDKKTQIISKHFQKCFSFMDFCRERGNILVHCKAGISRSATIIMGYLMYKFGYSLQEAGFVVKQANPKIRPNIGFLEQLQKYEQKLRSFEENPEETEGQTGQEKMEKKEAGQKHEQKKYSKKQILNCIQQLLKQHQNLQEGIKSVNNFINKTKQKSLNRSEYLQNRIKTYQPKRCVFIS